MGKKRSPEIHAAWIGAAALLVATLVTILWPRKTEIDPAFDARVDTQELTPTFEAFALGARFFPSGWAGDGQYGEQHLNLHHESSTISGETKAALRVVYLAGPEGWAGVYWQFPDGNWGDQPGLDLTGAREVVFLARGEVGGEIVEFKSGGTRGQYSDTLDRSLGRVVLTEEWKTYQIDLRNEDLSNVISPFAWIAQASEGETLTFWLADLTIR